MLGCRWARRGWNPLRAALGCRGSSSAEGVGSGRQTKITLELLDHLERLALVEFRNWEGVRRLESAVEFAEQLQVVNTDGVEPMESVLEDRHLYLREDNILEGKCAEELLKKAAKTVEGYFIAPPGNIPLPNVEERNTFLHKEDS
ncbi:glutamyl-tRNA(Gln) amidotransferase subunit C, mitochondrial isoform X1 [Thamnophis elegans]|uniref:glutamyl-tRNA(Gln) amidotransferase subunit C, mitochondrial isoform X1 n=1 Tax=Thamnophis elegans TaxID=35005 RepID=UPI001376F861|nr:glutamyl-tRNA(Gln) amidotransferase subunit C, mitochondrial isoform X1 [Thamnophis elegans]